MAVDYAGEGRVGRAMSFQTEWWFSLIEETHAFDRVTLEHGSSLVCVNLVSSAVNITIVTPQDRSRMSAINRG